MIERIGQRIKRCREIVGISQWALSRRSGLSQPCISNIERGLRTDVFVSTIVSIAQALGVSADTLLGTRPAPYMDLDNEFPTGGVEEDSEEYWTRKWNRYPPRHWKNGKIAKRK